MTQQFHFWAFILRKQNTDSKRHMRTPLFKAALFTVAKMCKQRICPSVDEWIQKMWYVQGLSRRYPNMYYEK